MPTKQAVEYHTVSNIVWGVNQILALLLPMVFLISGLGTRISFKTLRYGKYLTFALIAATLFVLNALIRLPLERIRTNKLSQTRSVAAEPLLQWIPGQVLESLPSVVLATVAAVLVFWLINRSPKRWWLWTAIGFSALSLVVLVGEPLFTGHKPIGRTPIESRVVEFAGRVGIPKDSIALETCEPVDSCVDAHVVGLGPTRLILLNEGLLRSRPESWTLQTFAHESKHFVMDDNLTGWVVLTFIFLVFFLAADLVCRVALRRFSVRLGFDSIAQAAAMPLLVLVLSIVYLIALPPINLFRQHVEFEADRYGLELTGNGEVLGEMVSSWTTTSTFRVPEPSPFFMLFRSSHPSDASRIAFANEFRPKRAAE
ncbi:MAG: M48 family metalloprotease [Acidobacteriota bacterium]|nr:MAG: M48 family metalloprotease [Acidobacteriota bacterium]